MLLSPSPERVLKFYDRHKKRDDPSSVWFHFLRDETKQYAKCKDQDCQHILKIHNYSTSNLHSHLRQSHNVIVFKNGRTKCHQNRQQSLGSPPPSPVVMVRNVVEEQVEDQRMSMCVLCAFPSGGLQQVEVTPADRELLANVDSLFDKIKQLELQISKLRSEASRRLVSEDAQVDADHEKGNGGQSLNENSESWDGQNPTTGHLRRQLQASYRLRRHVRLTPPDQDESHEVVVPGQISPEAKYVYEENIKSEPASTSEEDEEEMEVNLVTEHSSYYLSKIDIDEPSPSSSASALKPLDFDLDPADTYPENLPSDRKIEIDFSSGSRNTSDESATSADSETRHDWSHRGENVDVNDVSQHQDQLVDPLALANFEVREESQHEESEWMNESPLPLPFRKSTRKCALMSRSKNSKVRRGLKKWSFIAVDCVDDAAPSSSHVNNVVPTRKRRSRRKGLGTPFPCTIPGCPATFESTRNRGTHLRVVHSVLRKSYQCPHCPKLFQNSRSVFEAHVRIHSGEVGFVCEECGEGFKSKVCLRRHLFKHKRGEEARPFRCPQSGCPKSFSRKDHLTRHSRVHIVTRDFMCELCGKSFKAEAELSHHRSNLHAIPASTRLTTCRICESIFASVAQRDIHEKIHGGVDGRLALVGQVAPDFPGSSIEEVGESVQVQ